MKTALLPWKVELTERGFPMHLVGAGKSTDSFRRLADEIKYQNLHHKQEWHRIISYQGINLSIVNYQYYITRGWVDGSRGEFSVIIQGVYCNLTIPLVRDRSTRFFWNLLPFELKDICDQMIITSVYIL